MGRVSRRRIKGSAFAYLLLFVLVVVVRVRLNRVARRHLPRRFRRQLHDAAQQVHQLAVPHPELRQEARDHPRVAARAEKLRASGVGGEALAAGRHAKG
jgi:predicted phage tail protein